MSSVNGPIRAETKLRKPLNSQPILFWRATVCLGVLPFDACPLGTCSGHQISLREIWWTRSQRIRTLAEMPFEVPIVDVEPAPLYQRVSQQAAHMQRFGLSLACIARKLSVDDETVAKAIRWCGKILSADSG